MQLTASRKRAFKKKKMRAHAGVSYENCTVIAAARTAACKSALRKQKGRLYSRIQYICCSAQARHGHEESKAEKVPQIDS
jgi:hypothetical protein